MKKIVFVFVMFATMVAFSACSKDDDDDNNDNGNNVTSNDVVKVGEKNYKVYGIDSYYLKDIEQFVIGFYMDSRKIINNDIYFVADDFNINSITKDKVFKVNKFIDYNSHEEANSFTAFINDLHDNSQPLYSKSGTLKVLDYNASKREIKMEFNVTFDDLEDAHIKLMTGISTFVFTIENSNE